MRTKAILELRFVTHIRKRLLCYGKYGCAGKMIRAHLDICEGEAIIRENWALIHFVLFLYVLSESTRGITIEDSDLSNLSDADIGTSPR